MKTNHEFGLIIGRFQPPCLHHFQFIDQVIHSGIKKLLIGVGESKSLDSRNFLTGADVKSLLIPNLDKLNFSYQITVIPDINNPPKYADHVKKFFSEINQSNTCLFTDNIYTSDCFTNYGHNFQVIKPKVLPVRATNIRQMILHKDPDLPRFIPDNVYKFLSRLK